jgi:hypothetical protein
MSWLIAVIAIVVLVVAAVWFFAPTMKLFGSPDFEPAPKDDVSVEHAHMLRIVDAG